MKSRFQQHASPRLDAVTAEQVQAYFRDPIAAREPVEVLARAAEPAGPASVPAQAK